MKYNNVDHKQNGIDTKEKQRRLGTKCGIYWPGWLPVGTLHSNNCIVNVIWRGI